jgi:hypothetical protein
MRKTLTAGQEISFTTNAFTINLAIVSGDILYKRDSAITGASDEKAYALNEDLRTDSIFTGNASPKTIHIKAGASGAVIQYREE